MKTTTRLAAKSFTALAGCMITLQGIAFPAHSAPLAAEVSLAHATAKIVGKEPTVTGTLLAGGRFGSFVDNGGDLTGDGIDDVVVGAPNEADGGGRVYVFEGGRNLAGQLGSEDVYAIFEGKACSATEVECSLGLAIFDVPDRAGLGGVVGDVDGDGNADLVVTAPGIDGELADSGGAYIFYGPLEGSRLQPDATLLGESGDGVGSFEVEVGDIDGDGSPDIVIGAERRGGATGSIYIVHGEASRLSGDIPLDAAVELSGTPGVDRSLGRHMAIGELDGERGTDLVLCAEASLAVNGRCYILYGGQGRLTTGLIQRAYDASILGLQPAELLCCAGVADHDADGVEDIIIGGYGANGMTGYNAIFYSEHGRENRLGGDHLSTEADATIWGNAMGDGAGFYASAGDLNADGVTDIVLETFDRGALYIFYGARERLQGNLTMSQGDVRVTSEHPGDSAGWWFEARGDVTGDGIDDLVVGAPTGCVGADPETGRCTQAPGVTYVVAGGCIDPHANDHPKLKHCRTTS